MYYRVIPFSRSFDTFGLIYSSEEFFDSWKIVEIPFGTKTDMALVVWEIQEQHLHVDTKTIRDIISEVPDFSWLPSPQLQLISFISEYYITPIHHALNLFFPKNLTEKLRKKTFHKLAPKPYTYDTSDIVLTSQQDIQFQRIQDTQKNTSLLYGVTGSGKTQIYMKLIEDNLKNDLQTLLLIPEIILTSQIGERIQSVFWKDVLLLHSGVSAAKKTQYWVDILSGNAKIIIGTRSALFYPYTQLGSIIIDEEHDESYISDIAPRYQTVQVAEKLCALQWIPLILGSGTPKITSLYRWLQWEFEVLQLLEKYEETQEDTI